jgi:C1A family cysteine protease
MASLGDVQRAITHQGLGWEAGQTAIGEIVARGRFKGFGYHPKAREPSGGRDRGRVLSLGAAAFVHPRQVDWRDSHGDWTTPIKDQGACGSCVAFATNAVLEARYRIKLQDVNHPIDLSEAHLFFCGGPPDGCEAGWNPGDALKFCRDYGVAAESDFPYRPQQTGCGAAERQLAVALRVSRWRRLPADNDPARKKTIAERGPVIAGMHVHADFGWYRGGIYRPTTSAVVGRHAVAVVGYDEDEGYWIIKNSWGAGWGEGGWAKIGFGVGGLDSEFPFYDPDIA